jgi:hypothetical protein
MKVDRISVSANCMEISGYINCPCSFILGLALMRNGAHGATALIGFLLGICSATSSVLAGRWLHWGQSRGRIASIM